MICCPHSIFLLIIAVLTTRTKLTPVAYAHQQQLYENFDGAIADGGSSWFDASRWLSVLKVPTSQDTVWIDESDTYIAIDSNVETANVFELVVGRSGESNSFQGVQLDLLEGTKLDVSNDMIVGQFLESYGTVYASPNSIIKVDQTLTIGGGSENEGDDYGGSGIVILEGNAQITANDLYIGNASGRNRLIMDNDSKVQLAGDKIAKVNDLIAKGLIVYSPASSAATAGEEMKDKTFNVEQSNDGQTILTVVDIQEPSNSPTDAPVGVPTLLPTESPTAECKDLMLTHKRKNDYCKFLSENENQRKKQCNGKRKVNGKSIKTHWCPKTCNACDNTNDDTTGENNNNNSCIDADDLQYNDDPTKDCRWVSKRKTEKRCQEIWKNEPLSFYCPNTCGECSSS